MTGSVNEKAAGDETDKRAGKKREERNGSVSLNLEPLEQKIYEGIDFYPRSVEQIKEAAGVDIPYYRMQQILMKLCLTPYVRQVSTGFYEKNASTTGF